MMHTIELEDVQGYLIRGYSNMKFSRFVLLKVTDAGLAKEWIRSIAGSLTNAQVTPKDQLPDTCINIGFTAKGLRALGFSKRNINSFSPPFKEGMVTPHRSRLLGDLDSSAPEHWKWGTATKNPVHIVLLVFGKDKKTCKKYHRQLKEVYKRHGLKKIKNLDGLTLKDNKEHFGFRDGVAQPIIRGSGRVGPDYNCVDAGEFVLGYKNNYGVYPDSPRILKEQGEVNLLPANPAVPGTKDLGRNGTYLIIRQMEQDVEGFWDFMNKETANEDGSINEEKSLKLAARMVGRWPSGAPLSKFPDRDPGGASDDNNFLYAKDDPDGLKCPFGSHLRRMNPRDTFESYPVKISKVLSNRHRLIRRARLYGDPIIGSPHNRKPKGKVGIYFTCFSGDISRQFEFLHYTWSNFPKIKELYNDPDPIIGVREKPVEGQEQNFTIQAKPVNKTVKNLRRFITIRGGAYFFFPSITATRYIASV